MYFTRIQVMHCLSQPWPRNKSDPAPRSRDEYMTYTRATNTEGVELFHVGRDAKYHPLFTDSPESPTYLCDLCADWIPAGFSTVKPSVPKLPVVSPVRHNKT